MPLTLTPVSPGTLNLTPDPAGQNVVSSFYGVAVYGVDPYGSITGGPGQGLTLTPIVPGTLPLTPDPTN